MARVVIRNGRVLDVESGDYATGSSVLVDDGLVVEVGASVAAAGAEVIDARDRVVMPGLIDAHVHPMISSLDIGALGREPVTLLAQHARVALEAMLARGFTTVRDNCGGDRGLVRAVEQGLIRGPRLFAAGRALSQTGGHGDAREAGDLCGHHSGFVAVVADGVDEVRRAAREELRRGAHHLKIMASGGVASPSDEIWMLQYSADEMRAAVEEATARGTYVAAHAYGAAAITRAVEAGVRTIEHGNLLDTAAAAAMEERGAFLVPTLVAYDKISQHGEELGMPPGQLRKVGDVIDAGLGSLKIARDAGVRIGFGTDLLGGLQRHQSDEFRIRSRAEDPIDTIRSATVVNAEILGLSGRAGILQPGAYADLLIVDGDPLADAAVLADTDGIAMVMRAGEVTHTR